MYNLTKHNYKNDTIGSMIAMGTLNDLEKKTIQALKAIPRTWSLQRENQLSQRSDNTTAESK